MAGGIERNVSISEAALLTGVSENALRNRINRGNLPSEKRAGRRWIPLAALYDAGLLAAPPAGRTINELLDRLERQAEEIGRLRAQLEQR